MYSKVVNHLIIRSSFIAILDESPQKGWFLNDPIDNGDNNG